MGFDYLTLYWAKLSGQSWCTKITLCLWCSVCKIRAKNSYWLLDLKYCWPFSTPSRNSQQKSLSSGCAEQTTLCSSVPFVFSPLGSELKRGELSDPLSGLPGEERSVRACHHLPHFCDHFRWPRASHSCKCLLNCFLLHIWRQTWTWMSDGIQETNSC